MPSKVKKLSPFQITPGRQVAPQRFALFTQAGVNLLSLSSHWDVCYTLAPRMTHWFKNVNKTKVLTFKVSFLK